MLRLALRRVAGVAAGGRGLQQSTRTISTRFYGTEGQDGSKRAETVAREMIQYAFEHARSQRTVESYGQALRVLEQGVSNLQSGAMGEGDAPEDAAGIIMLAMSTLLYESGKTEEAMEKLQTARKLERATVTTKVAATEGLIGLHLEMEQDAKPAVLTEDCLWLLKNKPGGSKTELDILHSRAFAMKGLVDLAHGNIKTAELSFSGLQDCNFEENKVHMGNVALSRGEYLHATGNFVLAMELYGKVLQAEGDKKIAECSYLAAANMCFEETLLGAACSLGQLLSHTGNFDSAEEVLTKALSRAETYFGSYHPKVGVVLTCTGLMFREKSKKQDATYILLQEGIYRRALDLLKATPLDSEVCDTDIKKRDIVALTRGAYAEILLIQPNRKAEGERMKKWAESKWRCPRLSLAQALKFADLSEAAVIDSRIGRVL